MTAYRMAGIFNFDIPFHAPRKEKRRTQDRPHIDIKMLLGVYVWIVLPSFRKRIPCEKKKISWDLAHSITVLRAASTLSSSKAIRNPEYRPTLPFRECRSNLTGKSNPSFLPRFMGRPYSSSGKKSSLQILLFLILAGFFFETGLGEVVVAGSEGT